MAWQAALKVMRLSDLSKSIHDDCCPKETISLGRKRWWQMPDPTPGEAFFRVFLAALIFAIVTANAGLIWSLFELSTR